MRVTIVHCSNTLELLHYSYTIMHNGSEICESISISCLSIKEKISAKSPITKPINKNGRGASVIIAAFEGLVHRSHDSYKTHCRDCVR